MDDVTIDEKLVRTLLEAQHPDLADRELREVSGGWDHKLWRVGDDLAVRLPRTPRASGIVHAERRWLPLLAPSLPLPVPVPERLGESSDPFPRPWNVVRWIAGEPADRTPVARPEAADDLAAFLRALHKEAPNDAPSRPDHAGPLATHESAFDPWIKLVASSDTATAARRMWEDALAAPRWERSPVWVHGDLHPANVVVSDGTLAGVIDFGDLSAGDPAADLAAAWVLLPPGAAPRLIEAYGGTDEAMIRRACGWAIMRSLMMIFIGHKWEQGLPGGQPTWGPAGRAALERVLTSSER